MRRRRIGGDGEKLLLHNLVAHLLGLFEEAVQIVPKCYNLTN
jgi:hypothetical protein